MIEQLFAMSPGGGGSAGGAAGIMSLLPFVLIFFVIYFLMIRPQVKRQKETKNMLENLKKGDKIITTGGIIGTISGIKEKDNIVILKVDQNVKIDMLKTGVARVLKNE